ncbi:uncharacterized protein [Narcine bancroftii]|uniref:uncharacterized protein n=1 Tax=Narcine bancroftii TaxID=1343680 RepID=UPI003831B8B0
MKTLFTSGIDDSLFNLRRLQAHTKKQEQLVRELLFADHAALVAHSEPALQRMTSCFAETAKMFGLEVSLKKTEVFHQPAPHHDYQPPHISIGHTELKTVNQFTYLGCTISPDARIDNEIDNRLTKANSTFGRLHKRVWKNNHLKNLTKISIYRAVVIPRLLFSSESWVLYRHHLWLLERFPQRCLRSILNIHWNDFITNIEVLELAESASIESMLLKTQLCWVGHISRMEDHCLPKIVFYSELSTGHRDRGAPKKRYKDCLKKSLGACHIDHRQWADIASNHASWRLTVRRAATSFEEDRRAHIIDKRQRRKNPTPNSNQPIFPCNRCNRACLSRIGLVSHQRACSRHEHTSPKIFVREAKPKKEKNFISYI